jgi:hypothetical protein
MPAWVAKNEPGLVICHFVRMPQSSGRAQGRLVNGSAQILLRSGMRIVVHTLQLRIRQLRVALCR